MIEGAIFIAATALQTVPGDTPFVPCHLAATLSASTAGAVSDGLVYPGYALLPAVARSPLRDHHPGPADIAESFAEMTGIRRLDFLLATWDAFLNVNTPADFELARSQVDHLRTEDRGLG